MELIEFILCGICRGIVGYIYKPALSKVFFFFSLSFFSTSIYHGGPKKCTATAADVVARTASY
jgi:hypothetical protein